MALSKEANEPLGITIAELLCSPVGYHGGTDVVHAFEPSKQTNDRYHTQGNNEDTKPRPS